MVATNEIDREEKEGKILAYNRRSKVESSSKVMVEEVVKNKVENESTKKAEKNEVKREKMRDDAKGGKFLVENEVNQHEERKIDENSGSQKEDEETKKKRDNVKDVKLVVKNEVKQHREMKVEENSKSQLEEMISEYKRINVIIECRKEDKNSDSDEVKINKVEFNLSSMEGSIEAEKLRKVIENILKMKENNKDVANEGENLVKTFNNGLENESEQGEINGEKETDEIKKLGGLYKRDKRKLENSESKSESENKEDFSACNGDLVEKQMKLGVRRSFEGKNVNLKLVGNSRYENGFIAMRMKNVGSTILANQCIQVLLLPELKVRGVHEWEKYFRIEPGGGAFQYKTGQEKIDKQKTNEAEAIFAEANRIKQLKDSNRCNILVDLSEIERQKAFSVGTAKQYITVDLGLIEYDLNTRKMVRKINTKSIETVKNVIIKEKQPEFTRVKEIERNKRYHG